MNKYTDQEFTYRQVPVSYDGIAKLDSVKGNTVAWNQLVQNGDFASTSNWSATRVSISASSNVLTATVTEASTGRGQRVYQNLGFNDTHKRLYRVEMKGTSGNTLCFGNHTSDAAGYTIISSVTANGSWQTLSGFSNENKPYLLIGMNNNTSVGDSYQIRNVVCFDLTQMYGVGNEPSTLEEFTSLYPLSYYSFNQGTLVNFSGNGIKTTGASRVVFADGTRTGVGVTAVVSNGVFSASGTATSTYANLCYFNEFKTKQGEIYTVGLNKPLEYSIVFRFAQATSDTVYQQVTVPTGSQVVSFTANNDYNYVRLYISALTVGTVVSLSEMIPMIAHAKLTEYEPYKETITDLPTLTYFSNGIKSAGIVYDELTPSKAVTRVGSVKLGDLNWSVANGGADPSKKRMYSNGLENIAKGTTVGTIPPNLLCTKYNAITTNQSYADSAIGMTFGITGLIYVNDPDYESATDATAFKQMLTDQNVVLNYELATPTEQDINADLFYKFYGDGTEEILPSSLLNGSVDLGSLTWTYNTSGTPSFRADVTGLKYVTVATSVPNCLCSKYTTTSYDNAINDGIDKSISNRWNTTTIVIVDSDFTDATTFKNSLQGVMLWYEKSDSTPSTTPLYGDITYYNTFEGEVPYRKFWMVNSKGERWNLTERDVKTFLNNPDGLGFVKNISTIRYGNAQVLTDITDNFPSPSGEVVFYDSRNSTRYEQYNKFVRFLSYEPVTLYYKLPFSFYSQIPNVYTLECVVGALAKTESKNDNLMTCPITFNALSYYQGEEVNITGTGTSYTITNDGDFPVGFEITIEGSLTNPYILLSQDDELYGEAKFDDSTAFSSIYVNSNDGEQNVVLEQGGSILPNPLSYQDLSISNGSIYVTFVKLARGESALAIGMDSGSLTSATIKFAPIYRSV